jgi:twitching motility protein PilT
MERLNEYLKTLLATSSYELRLEPNRNPYIVTANGNSDIGETPIPGTEIGLMIFPLIPPDVKQMLPSKPEIQFVHPHNLGRFSFTIQKSPAGFNVSVRPLLGEPLKDYPAASADAPDTLSEVPAAPPAAGTMIENPSLELESTGAAHDSASRVQEIDVERTQTPPVIEEPAAAPQVNTSTPPAEAAPQPSNLVPPAREYIPPKQPSAEPVDAPVIEAEPLRDRRQTDRRKVNTIMQDRMDTLFRAMAAEGASDLHMSVSIPPLIRKDGKIQPLPSGEQALTPEVMHELLTSIMPEKNREEFARRNDTDFAYEISGLARFRCNVFMDRKGMGGVFRIIPSKILTAEDLGLSKAIMDLCNLSKGLVVVTGPTGSGKSTTLCAMVDSINKTREDHIITIEDPIEFVHENNKCLVNQREVHNHTDSFKDALRAALREDPDILLVGEMRDLETISIAIETAETGHLVFGTLHTTTAPSTVDRIIDQFPADRQQQIRVMLSESLKGVIAQTLLPKKGGGRVAALEVLIVTPAISNLIREGKTFQIPSAMQTGRNHGMVMLNDALFEHVQNGLVEPKDAYIKAVDKAGFEVMLTRGGFKL